MRILHLIDHLGLGGAQVAVADLVAGWRADDSFLVLGLGSRCQLMPRFEGLPKVAVEKLNMPAYSTAALNAVRRIVANGSFDIVHAHLRKASAVAAWACFGRSTPSVVHVHGDPVHSAALRWVLRIGREQFSATFVVSQATATSVSQNAWVRPERIQVVGNPVDLMRLKRDAVGYGAIRPQLNVRPSDFLLGFVGRLAPEKGLGDLLRAIARLRRDQQNVVAVIVGDGPLAAPLRAEAERLGISDATHFVGRQEHAARWIKACDALVLPSLTEGLPITILEAFALGIPVIASRVGGIPELIQNGETGMLISPRDVEGLVDAVQRLKESGDMRSSLATRAERLVSSRYANDQVARKVRHVYEGLTMKRDGAGVKPRRARM